MISRLNGLNKMIRLTQLEELEQEIYDCGIEVIASENLKDAGIIIKEQGEIPPIIGINANKNKSKKELLVTLSHELGHYNTQSYYNAESDIIDIFKSEYQAECDSVKRLAPAKEIYKRLKHGDNLFEIAEDLEVTPEFIERAIDIHIRKGSLPEHINSIGN